IQPSILGPSAQSGTTPDVAGTPVWRNQPGGRAVVLRAGLRETRLLACRPARLPSCPPARLSV
ncbi:MAG: hypothetical protein AAGJ39_10140, partial [Pseudomonadota bacterium]